MPENIGFPISETGGREYFMLEMHLDNPGGLPGITFDTGTVIHYTPNLRFSLDLKNINIETNITILLNREFVKFLGPWKLLCFCLDIVLSGKLSFLQIPKILQ
jgi:hypothetical protein